MKRYIVLSILLVATCVLFGQEKPGKNSVSKPPPIWVREGEMAAGSNYVDTFAEAFKDPNMLIGVFEYPSEPSRNTLSSGEILEYIPGYHQASIRFNLNMLKCIKPIKGQSPEPVVLVPTLFPPMVEERPSIPAFTPLMGSKWILALKKTSKEYRISRFGDQIEKYEFLNDRTMFTVSRYGHGALCLKWVGDYKKIFPKFTPKAKKPSDLVEFTESLVDDFKAIQLVIPYTQKEEKDPNEMAAITNTSKALKTAAAKTIFAKVLSDTSVKVQDPNDD
jgi:hypothetical protein